MPINGSGIDWPADSMFPRFQAPERLAVYDVSRASNEVQLALATLVGLINRPRPRVYMLYRDDDETWLQHVPASIEQQRATASNDTVLDELLQNYRTSVKGMIIYDPNVPDSINVATTLSGQEDGIVVSPEQAEALRLPYNLAVLADLRVHQWANGTAAYVWARQHLLAGASPRLAAGLDPRIPAGLRAFLVAARAFVYWLDPRCFLPDFRHGLPSQRRLMRQIFTSFAPGTVHLGWFIDEFSGVSLASEAALPVLASDFFTNLEVWTSIQPTNETTNRGDDPSGTNPHDWHGDDPTCVGADLSRPGVGRSNPMDTGHAFSPTPPQGAINRPLRRSSFPIDSQVYLSFTMSDGDNLQYMQHKMLQLWLDPARESVPLGWTVAPAIAQAAPVMAAYYSRTATANSELLAGPSGAGYIYPSRWPPEQLPAFLERSGQLMQHMNLTLLQVLDGGILQIIGAIRGKLQAFTSPSLRRAYVKALQPYGLHGILSGSGGKRPHWSVINGVPIYQNLGLASSPTAINTLVKRAAASTKRRPLFLNVYVEAWRVTPTQIEQVIKELGSAYTVVTPGSLSALIALAAGTAEQP
jgi:hypothetical protein